MSANNPGIIYDATNSWNGYNHQGKISMWYAISEITKLYNHSLSELVNQSVLQDYFLEIEYQEDFSVGKMINSNPHYISVHQVKNRSDKSIKNYESAILGLLNHISRDSDIEQATLHTTEEIDLAGKTLLDNIKDFIKSPQYIINAKNEINEKRDDPAFRKTLTAVKKGRPTTLKVNLQAVLTKEYSGHSELLDDNLDEAFDLYLNNLEAENDKLSIMTEDQLKKISINTYEIGGVTTNYCKIDDAVKLVKTAIKGFYQKVYAGNYKTTDNFVDKSCLWILGKLDEHIIERNLHYSLYNNNIKNRRISFSTIFDWLTSSEIDKCDSWYYLYRIKEGIFRKLEIYCKMCKKQGEKCLTCNVVECKNKLGSMSFDDFKRFIHVTSPIVKGEIDGESEYLGHGINNPFAKGLRDIPKRFDSESNAISYKNKDNIQCALTTIVDEGIDDDKALIASEILSNPNVYELLMDYDCLISKDINISSIKEESILQAPYFDAKQSEHIAHCKNVKIIPLDSFIRQLL